MMNPNTDETYLEDLITNVVNRTMQSVQQSLGFGEWMSLKEAAKYANVSHNTLKKFRLMGLKISEVDGVKSIAN